MEKLKAYQQTLSKSFCSEHIQLLSTLSDERRKNFSEEMKKSQVKRRGLTTCLINSKLEVEQHL